jgi:hypothetical protein
MAEKYVQERERRRMKRRRAGKDKQVSLIKGTRGKQRRIPVVVLTEREQQVSRRWSA